MKCMCIEMPPGREHWAGLACYRQIPYNICLAIEWTISAEKYIFIQNTLNIR